ncbi:MAG: amino acid synthesis family protein, partial [Paracoccaceae bacterium]
MTAQIRKTFTLIETVLIEGGRDAPKPLKLIAAAAVLRNPWAGRGFVDDLKPEIHAVAPELGALLTGMILEAAGGADAVEGYGKAAVVGLNAELEHGNALIHTLRFGNHYRQALGAKTYLAFTNVRGPAGCAVMIPLMDKHDEGRRSHYQTIHFSIPDAP